MYLRCMAGGIRAHCATAWSMRSEGRIEHSAPGLRCPWLGVHRRLVGYHDWPVGILFIYKSGNLLRDRVSARLLVHALLIYKSKLNLAAVKCKQRFQWGLCYC